MINPLNNRRKTTESHARTTINISTFSIKSNNALSPYRFDDMCRVALFLTYCLLVLDSPEKERCKGTQFFYSYIHLIIFTIILLDQKQNYKLTGIKTPAQSSCHRMKSICDGLSPQFARHKTVFRRKCNTLRVI